MVVVRICLFFGGFEWLKLEESVGFALVLCYWLQLGVEGLGRSAYVYSCWEIS